MSDKGRQVHRAGEQSQKTACVHCGDPCGRDIVSEGDLHFCCAGCRTVYALLRQSGLSTYYTLENSPGLKPASSFEEEKFAYLDKSSIRDRLLDFDDRRTVGEAFTARRQACLRRIRAPR